MPGPEECFESKQALNARFRESNRNISPIEKDYHTNLKECKNDILFIAYEILDQMLTELSLKGNLHIGYIGEPPTDICDEILYL